MRSPARSESQSSNRVIALRRGAGTWTGPTQAAWSGKLPDLGPATTAARLAGSFAPDAQHDSSRPPVRSTSGRTVGRVGWGRIGSARFLGIVVGRAVLRDGISTRCPGVSLAGMRHLQARTRRRSLPVEVAVSSSRARVLLGATGRLPIGGRPGWSNEQTRRRESARAGSPRARRCVRCGRADCSAPAEGALVEDHL